MPPKGARLSVSRVKELARSPVGARASSFACRGVPSSRFRLAVTAPKRVWAKSVDRNRARRRVREAFLGTPLPHPKMDLLVTCAAPALAAPFAELRAAAAEALAVYNRQA